MSDQPGPDTPAPWLSIVVPPGNDAGLRPSVQGKALELYSASDGLQVLRVGLAERRRDFVADRQARVARRATLRAEHRAAGLTALLLPSRLAMIPDRGCPGDPPDRDRADR